MKHPVRLAAFVIVLAGCNKGPTVELKNATASQVSRAVKQSGVMNADTMIEPGLWQSKVEVAEMNIPGLPPQYAEKMKQSMAESRNHATRHCITAADVKKPKEDFFGADKSCKYQHFTMGGGKIDIQMICGEEGATQTTNMSGTYTPTRYSVNMSSIGSGNKQSLMSMKMHVDSERVGECTGTQG
ncbi:MAG TPA: DUF3617 domain-containing protein [Sphingomicrobium sp.]|nr:DUF3617 domain-containing protein [Sphingomicrobium sp.]